MTSLSPLQLQALSDEYYTNGFVLGRDKLYEHMKAEHPNEFMNITPRRRGKSPCLLAG